MANEVLLAIMLGAILGIVVGLRRMYQMEKVILSMDQKLASLIRQRRKKRK